MIYPAQESICQSGVDGDIMGYVSFTQRVREVEKNTFLGTVIAEITLTDGDRHLHLSIFVCM